MNNSNIPGKNCFRHMKKSSAEQKFTIFSLTFYKPDPSLYEKITVTDAEKQQQRHEMP